MSSKEVWKANNPDKMRQYRAKWRANNRDKERELSKSWVQRNPERMAELHRLWKEAHPNYERDYHRKNLITIGGKSVRANKRPYPIDSSCEVCDRTTSRLGYHHWDDKHPCLGLYLCARCHIVAEGVDQGFHIKYLQERSGMVLMPPELQPSL